MEKIRSLLSPGKDTDDDVLYGSGTSADPVHSGTGNTGALSGEGSHFGGNNTDTTTGTTAGTTTGTGVGSSNVGTAHNAAGPHASNLENKADPRVDSNLDGSRTVGDTTGTTSGGQGYGSTSGSRIPGAFDDDSASGNPYSSHQVDPRVGSSNTATQGGVSGTSTTGNTSHLGRDAAVGAGGVGLAEHEHRKHESAGGYNNTGSTTSSGLGSGNASGQAFSGQGLSGNTNAPSSGHHLGRDAAVGAGGVGLAEHEHRKHEGATGSNTGAAYGNTASTTGAGYGSTTVPTTGAGYGNTASTTGTGIDSGNTTGQGFTGQGLTGNTNAGNSGHHLGRDAAIGAGGVGLAEHEHRKHEGATGTGVGNRGSTTGAGYGNTGSTGYGNTGSTTGAGYGNTGSTTGQTLPDRTAGTSGHHHLGRDAAAVGGAAAVGEGVHDHHQNERDNLGSTGYSGTTPSGTGSSYYGGPTGTAVGGPHVTETANRLDPHINQNAQPLEDARVHDNLTGGGAETADVAHGNKPKTAALGALGAGGVAIGEHEHHKHDKDLTATEREAKREHKHELKEEKKHKHDHDTATTGSSGHHFGRDAAGAGAVGTAAYEADKHHKNSAHDSTTGATTGQTGTSNVTSGSGPAPNTTGPHSKDWMNKLDPRVDSMAISTGSTGSRATTDTTGQDTAMRNRSAYVDPVARNNPGFVDAPGQTGATGTGTTGTGHHYGRDAAGAGAVGGAAYEAEKHHKNNQDVNDPAYGSTTSQTGITGTGTTGTGHHYGRDAAGAGALGTGAYEAEKHHKNNQNVNEPGYGSTTGQTGTAGTGTTGTGHHYGRDAAGTGAVGGAAYEAEKHHKNKNNESVNDPAYGSTSGQTGTTGTGHHYGRDAAGAGAVGGAAYEADKHHKHDKDLTASEKEEKRELKHEQKEEKKDEKKHHGLFGFLHRDKSKKYTPEEEAEFDRQEREHNSHKGRDAALGTAAVGGAGYEAEKHHHGEGSEHHQKWEGGEGADYAPPGTTLGDKLHGVERNRGVGATTTTGSEHNRLHKDPPSSHPASQGGVTADGKYIEPGTGRAVESGYGTTGTTGTTGTSGYGSTTGTGTGASGYGSTTGHGTGTSGYGSTAGGVPSNSAERRTVVGEGESRIAGDTGVNNPHNSSTTNY